MDPATVSAGVAVYKTFKETYNSLEADSEEEKLKQSTSEALKKFIFFYEDTHWSEISGETNGRKYRHRINTIAGDFREIAVKIDGKVDDELVQELRDISGLMEKEAANEPLTTWAEKYAEKS